MFTPKLWLPPLAAAAAAVLLLLAPALAQAPADAPRPGRPDQEYEARVNQAREDVEIMQAQIEAKQALLKIGESRLDEARRWEARYEKLLRSGVVTEDRYLAARDDVLMMQAHVAAERAELKVAEMRVKQAQRRLDYGELPMSQLERRLIELEQRLAASESKVDILQHEIGRLKRDTPKEGTGSK